MHGNQAVQVLGLQHRQVGIAAVGIIADENVPFLQVHVGFGRLGQIPRP